MTAFISFSSSFNAYFSLKLMLLKNWSQIAGNVILQCKKVSLVITAVCRLCNVDSDADMHTLCGVIGCCARGQGDVTICYAQAL